MSAPAPTSEAGASGSASGSGAGSSGGSNGPSRPESDAGYVGLRDPALAGVLLLTASYLSVLYRVTDVVGGAGSFDLTGLGGSGTFLLAVGGTFLLATLLGRVLGLRTAVLVTLALFAVGLTTYYFAVPASNRALFTTARTLDDTIGLLTGLSVLRLARAGVWALAIAPGPVFLSWYLALRGRYVGSVLVGGAALFLLVLTGDAGSLVTLLGVVGGAAAVGLGTLGEVGAVAAQWDTLAVVVAAMIVLSATLSVVPGGAAQPLLPNQGTPTVEGNVVGNSDRVDVGGSIRLSPKVRFTVESDEGHYWGTAAFDRYTGSGWVRTGEAEPYGGRLSGPPGDSLEVGQRVTAKGRLNVAPSAWKPVAVDGSIADRAEVTGQGFVRPAGTLRANESYTVLSEAPQFTREELREAGDDYPTRIEESYLQLPESTSDRVRERAAEVTAGEDNARDEAAAIERHLESNKEYSLTVDDPEGDVTDAFLFEMESGYCVHFASAMVVMLRSEGIPARFVTGYTSGQQVSGDEYVVRGLDSHAWVQVYFPDVGWVNFDPTPADPRSAAENARVEEARLSGEANVDAEGSGNRTETTPTPETPSTTTTPATTGTAAANATDGNGSSAGGVGGVRTPRGIASQRPGAAGAVSSTPGGDGGGSLPWPPTREQLGLGLALLGGLAAGGRRFGVFAGAYRTLRLYRQGARTEPRADVERAFSRLEQLLSKQYRERRPGETPRAYLQSLDNVGLDRRATEVGRLYERAHYGDGIDREAADEAIRTVNALVRERAPVVGRLFGRSP